ncbi:MAG TPA: winged helix-turn-helix domain-containing protein [Conexivisphaerales archaeon]|nr:winged helix-turn-helix domain-containing protein [Conexivisphaerales archaeon]
MTTYRSQVRVMADLLRAVRDDDEEGAKVTSLLRKANLSYSRMIDLTEELVDKGLIVKIPVERGSLYRLSDKGKEFLSSMETFEEYAKAFGLEI